MSLQQEADVEQENVGGIFTEALIDAFSRRIADREHGDDNGVTTKDELRPLLIKRVSLSADLKGTSQKPKVLHYGEGEFIFIHTK